MGHFRRIRIIQSKDILLNWLTALRIKDSELNRLAKQRRRRAVPTATLQSFTGRSSTRKGLSISGVEHASLALDVAEGSREATIGSDLNIARGRLGDSRKDTGLDKLASDIDVQVPLEDRDGHGEPRLQRHVLHRACKDITRGRSSRIGRSGFAGLCGRITGVNGDTYLQSVLIG